MTVGTLWYAQQAEAWIRLGAITTIAGGTFTQTLETLMGTASSVVTADYKKDWTGRIMSLSVTGGSRDFKALNTFGISQLAQQGRPEIVQCEFSIVYEDTASAQYISGTPYGVAAFTTGTYTGTFTRFQFGEKSTAAADRQKLAVMFKLTDGVKVVYLLLNNAFMTNRDISLNSDGYVEEKWTMKTLAQDYYEEDNF